MAESVLSIAELKSLKARSEMANSSSIDAIAGCLLKVVDAVSELRGRMELVEMKDGTDFFLALDVESDRRMLLGDLGFSPVETIFVPLASQEDLDSAHKVVSEIDRIRGEFAKKAMKLKSARVVWVQSSR